MGSISLFGGIRNLVASGSRKVTALGLVDSSQQARKVSTTTCLQGKRNFRKFDLGNKRGTWLFRRDQMAGKYKDIPIQTAVKDVGYQYDGAYHIVPEMIPEIIVPDLSGCELKPYVSYRTADIYQSEFTAQDLFDVVYRNKISKDFKENKLDEEGNPLEPSKEEKLTPEEAWAQARKTGSDLFSERIPKLWECLEKNLIEEKNPSIQFTSDDLTHPSEQKRLAAQAEHTPTLPPSSSKDLEPEEEPKSQAQSQS